MDQHPYSGAVTQELATLYALEALSPDETRPFMAHLGTGCHTCAAEVQAITAIAGLLGYTALPVAPRPEVRERLLARVRSTVQEEQREQHSLAEQPQSSSDWVVVRAAERAWEPGSEDGVWIQHLFLDPVTLSSLVMVRLERGARYPHHWPAGSLEFYLLSGNLAVAGQVLQTGDYGMASMGDSDHLVQSPDGGTFLLFASGAAAGVVPGSVAAAPGGMQHVRAVEYTWRDSGIPGVQLQPLYTAPQHGARTALVRMQAGAGLPRHRHVTDEHFYMLEGDGHVHGQVLYTGDYYRAAAGTIHDVTYTEGGCLFLLMASRMEILV